MRLTLCLVLFIVTRSFPQNHDPYAAEIVTTDLDNFWIAFDSAQPDFTKEVFQRLYLDKGSKGLTAFVDMRFKSAERLSNTIKKFPKYYASTRTIAFVKDDIIKSYVKLKEIYPGALFPPVYFVVGAMSTAGTAFPDGLIVGTEMFGRTPDAPIDELLPVLQPIIKSPDDIPPNVAHEVVHFQQRYNCYTLLEFSLKEGTADFIGEMISGRHINQNIHDFANPKEEELWREFKKRMNGKNQEGWLYSSSPGRPNDLAYWMGYKIVKAYYDKQPDKAKAIHDIINIEDAKKFVKDSSYGSSFR